MDKTNASGRYRLVMPAYSRSFRCIAGACEDSCCIGWDVEIDDRTAERYAQLPGSFGDRIRAHIDPVEQCFLADEALRCPFLNADGLCDIITELGEAALCDICDRHPRYFTWLDGVIEGGIGLCCPEAARRILSAEDCSLRVQEAPERLCSEVPDPYDPAFLRFLQAARANCIALLTDTSLPLETALDRLTAYALTLQDAVDNDQIDTVPPVETKTLTLGGRALLSLLTEAEPLPGGLDAQALWEWAETQPSLPVIAPEDEPELRNIAVYFVWRYLIQALWNGLVSPRLWFAAAATRIIALLFQRERAAGALSFDQKCTLAKDFSKLIEYSEENLWLFLDAFMPDAEQ